MLEFVEASLDDVSDLVCLEVIRDSAQWAAQSIDGEMYLGRQTTSGSPQSLVPPFEPLPVAAC